VPRRDLSAPCVPARLGEVEPATTSDSVTVIEHTNFAVSDRAGDIVPGSYHGFFVDDTRFLSRLTLRIGGKRPEALSTVIDDHGAATFYLTNPTLGRLPASSVAVMRDRAVTETLSEHIRLISYVAGTQHVRLTVSVGCDFADIFEVRGWRRMARAIQVERTPRGVTFDYEHRGYRRRTDVVVDRDASGRDGVLTFDAELERGVPWDLNIAVSSAQVTKRRRRTPPPARVREPERVRDWLRAAPTIVTDDVRLAAAWRQAVADIGSLLLSVDGGGFIPAAGMPWYMAIFGRDAAITSMQTMLMGSDELVEGTLRQLAMFQGRRVDTFREEQPGKIPHEVRNGELAMLDHVPHGRYYGSVDATPLFVLLFLKAARWSGWLRDEPRGSLLRRRARTHGAGPAWLTSLLPAVRSAMAWIDEQADTDGLIWYRRQHRGGIRNQVWKDSNDSYRFADGRMADPPIAALEVQGYVVAARHGWAAILDALDEPEHAARQRRLAAQLAETIESAFWMPDAGTYAMGIDRRRRQIDAVTSNPGHLLWAGVIPEPRAADVAARLMADDSFSGWGIRTMSSEMAAYNPLSYHNGTIWPHDNSLIAAGLARYGHDDLAWRVIDAQLDAAAVDPDDRLPELFAGFGRRTTTDLVRYAVACSPQAWASGAIALYTETLLGLIPRTGVPRQQPMAGGPRVELAGAQVGTWRGTLGNRQE
jgi:glycogen debranching enzyme